MVQVEIIATDALGDRSYIAHDGHTAVVIDPQRDIDRVLEALTAEGLSTALVCETHRHNDYVTGGSALAQLMGARYIVPAGEDIIAERHPVSDRDELAAGGLRVRVVATPGHTDGHVAYVVDDGPAATTPPVAFTGGSLLYGSVGRPDLVAESRTEELAHTQYHSVRRLAGMLPDETMLYPTHGFGSFCSSGGSTTSEPTTIGHERSRNDALSSDDEDGFVARLVAGLTAYPAYYAHIGELNRMGPDAPDLSPPEPVDSEQLRKRITAGEWVVDLRSRRVFAAGHLAGSIGVELANPFATYLGWLIPWHTSLTLLGESREQVAQAQRQLVRIGIDRLAGATTEPLDQLTDGQPLRDYPVVDFAGVAAARGRGERPSILDVRRDDEWAAGHVDGAVHVPLHELTDRMDELATGPLWVHCASGYRASIAAALLDRADRDVVLVDDDYGNAAAAGIATTTP